MRKCSVKYYFTRYPTSGNLYRESLVFAAKHWIETEVKSQIVIVANNVLVTLRTNCSNIYELNIICGPKTSPGSAFIIQYNSYEKFFLPLQMRGIREKCRTKAGKEDWMKKRR